MAEPAHEFGEGRAGLGIQHGARVAQVVESQVGPSVRPSPSPACGLDARDHDRPLGIERFGPGRGPTRLQIASGTRSEVGVPSMIPARTCP